MNFALRITTDANTSKANAKKTELKLLEGTITNIIIFFPQGHKGLSHLQIFDGEVQILPTNLGENYSVISEDFKTNYQIHSPWNLILKTWNTDTVYDHDILIRITLKTKSPLTKALIQLRRKEGFLGKFIRFLQSL